MAKLYIDNKAFEADERDNLLKVALSEGFDLPYFCWHPCLDSVGACRQCAVKQYKDEDDTQGSVVMACMTPAADGTRIAIDEPEVRDFRASIVEWLMINHPHDCPVCEEGGECHLQDMTLMTGHTRRRYRGTKRTHRNQDLGPFISHEMNRCIACYRCVRYYRDYAGGGDLEALGPHDHVYFGRQTDGPLESPFSGNLVEVCPTGVFTDKTLGAHYTRKWDMQAAPGICTHCSLGCNTSPGERKGVLKRVQNRYHGKINGYFLCDRGRFGAGFVNRDDRPRTPLLRDDDSLRAAAEDEALERIRAMLHDSRGVVGIGSPRASLESNHALRRLIGEANFATGMGAREQALTALALDILRAGPARIATLRETESCDAVLVLGEDPTHTAPRLALSLRQSVRNAARRIAEAHGIPRWHDRAVRDIAGDALSPLHIAAPAATDLDDVATARHPADADGAARLGFAVAHRLDAEAPEPAGLDDAEHAAADTIAAALRGAERPLVVAGTAAGSEAVLRAAGQVARALGERGRLFLTLNECNSAGAALLGGLDVDAALRRVIDGETDTLVVVENDLYRRAPADLVDAALDAARHLIVIDHSAQPTAARADAVLPAGSFAEADGTLVNNEGRAQRFFQVYVPHGGAIREAWRWCDLLGGVPERALDAHIRDIEGDCPTLAGIADAAPGADFRLAGMRMPRAPHRYSGRTAMYANESVHERPPVPDPDSALAYSMEGYQGVRPAALTGFAWAPRWNSNQQAIAKFQDEVAGHLAGGDPGVRLLEAGPGDGYAEPPEPAARPRWLAVPRHHIFGGEPLSAAAPAIAERAPAPYVALHPDDAAELGLAEGDTWTFTLGGTERSLPVALDPSLLRGRVGVPVGLGGQAGVELPGEVTA